ncbi:MAG: DUF2029 domain-containing protein [Chloroflexi bacterium]|nr:DUF2029 domain-containing protein [Chloroflexota bacterium]
MRKPIIQLAALAIASALIYALALVWRYSLIEWWSVPHQTIAKISNHDPFAAVTYVLALSALFLLYALACRIVQRNSSAAMWRVAMAGAIAFNVILLWLYPVDAADIFDNIIHGRMQAYYAANPFYQTAIEFEQDRFFKYVAWEYFPSAYGPGWEWIAANVARAAGEDVVANVIAFKLVGVFAYAATTALIAMTLRQHARGRALYGALFFAWNPMVLYATVGNGHNDVVMVLFIALGFYFHACRRFTFAALALTAGALIKFIPVLLLPIILVAALKQLRAWRARVTFGASTLAACALLVAIAYAPFWRGGDVLGIARRSDLFTTSLPALIQVSLEPSVGESFSARLAIGVALVLLGAWIVRQMRVLWRRKDVPWNVTARAGASILLFYLLVSCLWFQPWYTIWSLALIALLPEQTLTRGALVLSFVATWKMPLFEFLLVPAPPLPPRAWREWRITPGVLGAAWAFCVYPFFNKTVRRINETRVTRHRETSQSGANQNSADSALGG